MAGLELFYSPKENNEDVVATMNSSHSNLIFVAGVNAFSCCDISLTKMLGTMTKYTMRYNLHNNFLALWSLQ